MFLRFFSACFICAEHWIDTDPNFGALHVLSTAIESSLDWLSNRRRNPELRQKFDFYWAKEAIIKKKHRKQIRNFYSTIDKHSALLKRTIENAFA